VLPMGQIVSDGMSPMHSSIPGNMIGCMLVAEMPASVVPNESVWIVHPTASRREMKYRDKSRE
jgi:hypothetical protein